VVSELALYCTALQCSIIGGTMKKSVSPSWLSNLRTAQAMWGSLAAPARNSLRHLTKVYTISVAAGDVQLMEGRWYITHAGLLGIAERQHCSGIRTSIQSRLSNPEINKWIFKATVYKTPSSKGFVGYGDADPSNTSVAVQGAKMRIAETRAVNRALSLRNRALFRRGTGFTPRILQPSS